MNRKEVEKFVLKIGVSPAYKGFDYVISAIEILIKNRNAKLTKDVYPVVAEEYGTNSPRVYQTYSRKSH